MNSSINKYYYAGRQIDLIGLGLSTLLCDIIKLKPFVFYSLIGRLYSYKTLLYNQIMIAPTYEYYTAILNAITLLGIKDKMNIYTFETDTLDYDSFFTELDLQLATNRVLVGPFHGKLFENEFIHSYITEPMHCLICLSKNKTHYLCLHPDGMIKKFTGEELFSLLKISTSYLGLLISCTDCSQIIVPDEIILKSLLSGAHQIKSDRDEFGRGHFIQQIIDMWDGIKKSTSNDLILKYTISNIYISLSLLNQSITSLLLDKEKYESYYDCLLSINQKILENQNACSHMTHHSKVFLWDNKILFHYLLETWIDFEDEMLNLLSISKGIK